jgi:type I restriction enzyme, S subunit
VIGRVEDEPVPRDWIAVSLKAIVTKLVDGSHNPPSKRESGVPMLSARNVLNGQITFDGHRLISKEDFEREHTRTRISPGDVLLTIVGTIGRSAVVPASAKRFSLQRSVAVITPRGVLPKYLMYQFQAPFLQRHFEKNARGTAQKGVYLKTLGQTPILVAPLGQQELIVAEIEKQFSRLDEAVANLRRVKANLKRYKASVLKAAVEGKLTEDWRKQHPDVEPASKLLERILAERQKKWSGRGKYEEPSAPETTDLPSLPKGWTGATVEQLSILVQYGSSSKTSEEAIGIPVLRMGNIEDARLRIDSLKFLPKNHDEFPGLFLRAGDILFNRTNSAELVGKTAVYKGKPDPCSFASYLIRVRLIQGCAPDLLAYFINSVFGRAWIAQVVSQQVGQANVNGTKLQALSIPLPPLDEQGQIVAEVERRLSVIEKLQASVEANLTRADRLRQSVLKSAFSGKLSLTNSLGPWR